MDKKQFQRRVYVVSGVLGLLFFLFVGVLYQLQIIQGPYYRAQATKRNAQTETVEAVRGEILDCNGRVMVSNRSTYQVRLNTSVMGTEEERNAILTALLQICREQGVTWTDTLPVTGAPPFEYTLGTATGTNRRAFLKLMDILSENNSSWETASASGVALGEEWEAYRKAVDAASQTTETGTQAAETPAAPEDTVSAAPLIAKMKDYFGIDPTMPDEEARDLIGVLYELTLRSKGAATSEYIFAQDVDIRFITAVKEQGLKGVKIEPTTTRVYETSWGAWGPFLRRSGTRRTPITRITAIKWTTLWERKAWRRPSSPISGARRAPRSWSSTARGRWSARPGRPTPRPESPWPPNRATMWSPPSTCAFRRRWSSLWLPGYPDSPTR